MANRYAFLRYDTPFFSFAREARMPAPDFSALLDTYFSAVPEGRIRLFHGRGKTLTELEWLTVDRLDQVLVATVFRAQDAETLTALETYLSAQMAGQGCTALMIQHRYDRKAENHVIQGELPEEAVATEAGLRYRLDFRRGQNLGFFPDMGEGRAWVRSEANDKKVLNLFSFTCSLSVAALAGGASSVVNIDLSDAALALGKQNHALNGFQEAKVHYLPHNIFRSWKKLHSLGRYDMIIIDPPSAQKGSFMVEKDYPKLLRKLHKLLAPQAQILACVNAPWLDVAWLENAMAENLPGATLEKVLPITDGFAEAGNPALKALVYRYERPEALDA